MHSGIPFDGAPAGMDPQEWQLRCELAACYQLTDLYGMSDLAGTHISVRLPGERNHFLLNPLGMLFDEITASSLIKVDLAGNVVEGDAKQLNPAGFVIHSAIHMHDRTLVCVMHTHTRATIGVGMQAEGLLPLTQKAIVMRDMLRYHPFEGAALDEDERERIVRDLGPDGRVMLLCNHGALSAGRTVAEAWAWMYRLEAACRYQVDGLAGGRPLRWLSPEVVEHTAAQGRRILGPGGYAEVGALEWPGLIRKLERDRGRSFRS
ncbi:MAG: class II aldolase/adducin family protein [Lautropia sp.]